MLITTAAVVLTELDQPCPPGGPLSFGACEAVRPFAIGVTLLAAVLYVGGLSAVRWWTAGLLVRGVADARAARDWYLLAAILGLLAAPLLSFTLVSALR